LKDSKLIDSIELVNWKIHINIKDLKKSNSILETIIKQKIMINEFNSSSSNLEDIYMHMDVLTDWDTRH